MQSFLTRHPVSYPIGRVDKRTLPRELAPSILGVQVRPTSFLIAPDGSVAKRYVGKINISKLKLLLAARRGKMR